MPLYEYKCTNCGKVTEFILKSGEAPDKGCGHCGEKRLERVLFSTFAVGGNVSGGCDMKDICGASSAPPCCGGHCKH